MNHELRDASSTAEESAASLMLCDAAKYRWMRANRGNFSIALALNHSERDADFDAHIEAAMRLSISGRHYYSNFHDIPTVSVFP